MTMVISGMMPLAGGSLPKAIPPKTGVMKDFCLK